MLFRLYTGNLEPELGNVYFHKKEEPVKSPKYTCDICGDNMYTKSGMKRHLQMHYNTGYLKCRICQRTFTTKGHYEGHINQHENRKPYKCLKCGTGYSYRSALLRHTTTCNGKEKEKMAPTVHLCSICGAVFNRKDTYTDHMRGKHEMVSNYKLTCSKCGATFRWRSSLNRHMNTQGHTK